MKSNIILIFICNITFMLKRSIESNLFDQLIEHFALQALKLG